VEPIRPGPTVDAVTSSSPVRPRNRTATPPQPNRRRRRARRAYLDRS
jgi:hypothetical protein